MVLLTVYILQGIHGSFKVLMKVFNMIITIVLFLGFRICGESSR
jgi:hypothetical protein